MYKAFVVREESFGYTFFDKSHLKHTLLLKHELGKFLRNKNILLQDVEYLAIKEKKFRKDILYSPIRVYFELTLACTLRCKYCYNSSGRPRDKELSMKKIFKILDDLKMCNVIDLRFTGGELTCRKDWFDILKYAKELGFAVSCNTNAVFNHSKIPELFAKLNIEQVTVSVDGCQKNHEYNRGKGTFDKVILNLQKMHDLGVKLRINTLVNNRSVHDAEFMLKLASQFVEEINFFTVVFLGRGSNLEKTDSVSMEDHLKMSQKIKEFKVKYPHLRIFHFAEVSKTTSVGEKEARKFGLKIGIPSGITTLNISSDGYYYCGGYAPYIDSNLSLENTRTKSFFDIWQNNAKLEKNRNDSMKLILFCNKCDKFKKQECQGSKYETELIRLIDPKIKNPACVFGNGQSLLEK